MRKLAAVLLGLMLWSGAAFGAAGLVYYISPSGNDANGGGSCADAYKTFFKAFSVMAAGDQLRLCAGTYASGTTGLISSGGTPNGEPPSGNSGGAPTQILTDDPAVWPTVNGALKLGTSATKVSFVTITGIYFYGKSSFYNTNYCEAKRCFFADSTSSDVGAFAIGTNDHNNGNTYNLIEDCWVLSKNRIGAINYRADRNVWRRVVIRTDGCDTPANCNDSDQNPNVGFTIYNSQYCSAQNVIVIDRRLGNGSAYGDFATAQHDPEGGRANTPNSNNEWLGCISLNTTDTGYHFENAACNDSTVTITDCIAWKGTGGVGFNIGGGACAMTATMNRLTSAYHTGSGVEVSGIRYRDQSGGSISNSVVHANQNWGVSSNDITPSYMDADSNGTSASGNYRESSKACVTGCLTSNPLTFGLPHSIIYVPRIEPLSPLNTAGSGGGRIGANVIYKYGTDDAHYNEAGYNTITSNLLWPWPNEAQVKTDMCSDVGESRGFCGDTSLSHYIWNSIGNGYPYGGAAGQQNSGLDYTPPAQAYPNPF